MGLSLVSLQQLMMSAAPAAMSLCHYDVSSTGGNVIMSL
jgi:hypothetical protein